MKQILSKISFETSGEGFTNITSKINRWICEEKISKGILVIFCKHTSCSLIINENADSRVLKDLLSYMKAIVPEEQFFSINRKKDRYTYLHSDEGKDDMPAHIKTILTSSSLNLSIQDGELVLGTWQAIYLWEHRHSENTRKLHLHFIGDVL